jgi:c-di-GMP-binding flagellar brake protein YcgR
MDRQQKKSGGMLSKSPYEIMRVLEAVKEHGETITAALDGGKTFSTRLLWIDPELQAIAVAPSADPAANAALLARPRCDFVCTLADWHVEFVAAEPRAVRVGGKTAIRLRFPEIMAGRQRRAEPRAAPKKGLPLRCLADADGVMAFDAHVIDISSGGVGMLLYRSEITLEPGTLLRGCLIEHPAIGRVRVDMEVRYSEQVTLKDGRRAWRSGCRFVDPDDTLKELVRRVTGKALGDDA